MLYRNGRRSKRKQNKNNYEKIKIIIKSKEVFTFMNETNNNRMTLIDKRINHYLS